jgi:hypothetical protein
MKILVSDYVGFKNVTSALGPFPHVIYSKPNAAATTASGILALSKPNGFYVSGNISGDLIPVTQVLSDYPGAFEAVNVEGVY